jgi:hypothetical protein
VAGEQAGLAVALAALAATLAGRGLRLQQHADTAQLVTAPDLAREIEAFLGLPTVQRLSHAALETVAVIAYRQPAGRLTIAIHQSFFVNGAKPRWPHAGATAALGARIDDADPASLYDTDQFKPPPRNATISRPTTAGGRPRRRSGCVPARGSYALSSAALPDRRAGGPGQ